MFVRPRRNRKSESLRRLVCENHLRVEDLIAPLFVIEGKDQRVPVDSMPGQYRYTPDTLCKKVGELQELGIPCVSLFPALDEGLKDSRASESWNPDGLYLRTVKDIKEKYPEMLVMTDVAMDPYSSDGHDGYVDPESGEILNDETLEILSQMALAQARAGSDIVGPSDMMDGRVGVIRKTLESEGFTNVNIMSYTAKYASAFYGPFRDALDSAPKKGDKKTYQMQPSNTREALHEARQDEQEGADILMVKPGMPYLDVIRSLREQTQLPVAAYNVSGEYAMIKAAHEKGWLDGPAAMMEMLTGFKRAGADMILTYFAEEAARELN